MLQEEFEEKALTTFLEMVKAPDGDFDVIDRLAQVLADLDSLEMMIEHLSLYPQGKKAFQEWPLLGEINLENLHNLPTNTLGYCYAEHLIKNNLKPLNPKQVNNKYEFLGAHITETHDIWHVITNSNTDILGEIKLEAFYVAQLAYSRFWLALLSKNLLKSTVYNIEVAGDYLDAVSQGWIMGKQAQSLFGIKWNDFWEKPLEDIRIDLNIII